MSDEKLTEKEQIKRLKEIALSSSYISTREKVMDTLATYGEKAIPSITDIIDSSTMVETREHGLDVIKKLKEKSTSR